jgi:hypothetical protein
MLWDRVNPPLFARHLRRLSFLHGTGGTRVALPQDEHLCARALVDMIHALGIDHVFSVAPETEWDKLYAGVDRSRVSFSRVLTGYLSPETLARTEAAVSGSRERPIAIGYRAARVSVSLGRHGLLKAEVAERVRTAAIARGLPVDIAIGPAATIRGDAWYRFLASCRYTIGVEGGASVLDEDGSLQMATARFLAEHPQASFEDIERACFPTFDGGLRYFAISPRHLEACATRTAQVLIEGEYNGILQPGVHYIELRRDFSNLTSVIDQVADDRGRERITDAAYRDVVASGAYTYARFVHDLEEGALRDVHDAAERRAPRLAFAWARAADKLSWLRVATWVWGATRLRLLALRVLPEPALRLIRRQVAGTAAETAALQSAE